MVLTSGEYTVEAIIYDSASVQQDKKTVIVTVGADPDFYVTAQDIQFSQVKTIPSGLEVSVDTSIHYENDNTPRDVDVKFYVKPKYKGYFLSGISVDNVYYVFTSGNVDHVKFDMNGNVKTDNNGADGWSMTYDLGSLPFASKLTITAFSDAGIPSEPFVIMPKIVELPDWVKYIIDKKVPKLSFHGNIIAYALGPITFPTTPINVGFPLPSWIPLIGGPYKLAIGSLFGCKVSSDGIAQPYGKGHATTKIDGGSGDIGITLKGIVKFLQNMHPILKLESANINIAGSVTIPGPKWGFTVSIPFIDEIGIEIGTRFIPGLDAALGLKEDSSGGVIAGLGWKSTEGTLSTAVEGYGNIPIGTGFLEVILGGKPSLTFQVPEPYFKKVAVDLYAKWKAVTRWSKEEGSWSSPGAVTDNYLPEFEPSVMFDSNGNAIGVWTLFNNASITANTSVFSVLDDVELAYSVWDKNTKTWSAPKILTNNSMFEGLVSLSNDINGDVSATWIVDKDNNISTTSDRDIYYSIWNGSDWSELKMVTNDVAVDVNPVLAYSTYDNGWSSPKLVAESLTIYEMGLSFDSDNNAVVVWQGASPSGQDIYYTVCDNSNQLWCGEKQLTNDTSAEWQLSTTIDSKNEIMISYVKQNITIFNHTIIEGESDLCYLIHPIMLDLSLDSSDIIFSNETAYPGDTITINATIHNIGDLQANSVEVKFSDGLSGPQIGTTQTIPSLPAGQNATVSVTWNIPGLQQSHDIYVKVDPDDKHPETNESNNVAFTSIVLPDLKINESDVTTLINATTIAALSPNSNKTISTVWNTQGVSTGLHNISVIIDRIDGIREQNETNNIANLSLMILPDLTVNANNVSFSETSEGNITIDVSIRNIGISKTENITTGFFDGDPFKNGTLISSAMIDSISADSDSITEIRWYATQGQHDIYVQIDPSNLIPELDKSNNLAFNPVIITPGADLMLNSSDIIFSDANETGQVTISAIIHNVGFADVPYTTIEFYNGTPNVSATNPYVTNIPNSLGSEVVPLVSSKGYVIVNLSTKIWCLIDIQELY